MKEQPTVHLMNTPQEHSYIGSKHFGLKKTHKYKTFFWTTGDVEMTWRYPVIESGSLVQVLNDTKWHTGKLYHVCRLATLAEEWKTMYQNINNKPITYTLVRLDEVTCSALSFSDIFNPYMPKHSKFLHFDWVNIYESRHAKTHAFRVSPTHFSDFSHWQNFTEKYDHLKFAGGHQQPKYGVIFHLDVKGVGQKCTQSKDSRKFGNRPWHVCESREGLGVYEPQSFPTDESALFLYCKRQTGYFK